MSNWAFTTYERDARGTWTITEHHNKRREPRHGVHAVRIKGDGAQAVVYVHDDTAEGLDWLTVRKFAEAAIKKPLYWSDERCVYWFYDFELWGHWCELLTYESAGEPLEIRIYS